MTTEKAIEFGKIFLKSIENEKGSATYEFVETAVKMMEQEPVLDKIREEIEALIEWHDCPIEYDNGNDAWYCEACNQAIKIIDKYKAESEDK